MLAFCDSFMAIHREDLFHLLNEYVIYLIESFQAGLADPRETTRCIKSEICISLRVLRKRCCKKSLLISINYCLVPRVNQ